MKNNKETKIDLLTIARKSITYYLTNKKLLTIDSKKYNKLLFEKGACFVTLNKNKQLRGCIGSIQATRPLIIDVAQNAIASAFKDYRFSPLSQEELPQITIDISVLSPMKLIENTKTEAALLEQLNKKVDGLMITDGIHQATFLPQVWEQLPKTQDFIQQLKLKAGLKPTFWSEHMKCYRYHCEKFSESE